MHFHVSYEKFNYQNVLLAKQLCMYYVSSYLKKFYLYDKIDKDENQLQAQYTCTFTLMCY